MKKLLFTILLGVSFIALFAGARHVFSASDTSSINVGVQVYSEPLLITDLSVYDISKSNAKIIWKTNRAATCQLFFGLSPSYGNSRLETDSLTNHYFELNKLTSNMDYHYKIVCQDQFGIIAETPDKVFRTLKGPKTPESTPTPGGVITPSPTPTEETIPEKINENVINETIIGKIIDSFEKFAHILAGDDLMKALNGPLVASAIIASVLALMIPAILNMPLLAPLSNIYALVLSFFGWFGKKKKWGIVYDSENDQPVAMAVVRVYDSKNKKLLDSQLTDREGRFGFKLDSGLYYFEVFKENYIFPSVVIKSDYHKEKIKIDENNQDKIFAINIPIDPIVKKLSNRIRILTEIGEVVEAIRIPLLLLSTLISICFYAVYPITFNLLVLVLYGLFWIMEIFSFGKANYVGHTLEASQNAPVGLTIVRVFDENTGKIVSTKVSDINGSYFHLVSPGLYNVKATKENYEQEEVRDLHVERGSVLNKNLYLKKS